VVFTACYIPEITFHSVSEEVVLSLLADSEVKIHCPDTLLTVVA